MPANVHPEFVLAEKKFHLAKTSEEKLEAMEEMIRAMPQHKSAESLRANLRRRYKKLKESIETKKKSSSRGKVGIKKEDMQAVIIGKENSGKSSLLEVLTNSKPHIAEYPFTTKYPEIGMMTYSNCQIQLIENPAINSESYDRGLTNSADVLLILITSLEELTEIEKLITNAPGKRIIVFNKIDLKTEQEKRKINAFLQTKKYNFQIISCLKKEGIEELKEKIFKGFGRIRVFTKEPGKEKSNKPVVLNPGAIVKDIAEKILKGFSSKVVYTKIWGPSSKFSGQIVSLNHELKDLDVVEFKTN